MGARGMSEDETGKTKEKVFGLGFLRTPLSKAQCDFNDHLAR